jgi:hypothetical protein
LRSRRSACWPAIQARNSSRFRRVEEISQQVRGVAVQFGGKLDAADQFQAGFGGRRQRLVVSLEGVVIRDAEDGHPGAMRFRHQLRGRAGAVGFVSVRVEIDQS